MRTTVRLPDALLALAKKKAREEGTTLTALIERGLCNVLRDQSKTSKRRQVELPVSSARGGLMPGIDPIKFTEVYEQEDREYVERMNRLK